LIFVQFADIASQNCLHCKYPSMLWVSSQIYVDKTLLPHWTGKSYQ